MKLLRKKKKQINLKKFYKLKKVNNRSLIKLNNKLAINNQINLIQIQINNKLMYKMN